MEWYLLFFFRFLNFAAIIGIAWYLFVYYLAPSLTHEINEEQEKELQRQQKQQLLETTITELTQQAEKERVLYATMKNRIIAWHAMVEDGEKKKQEQRTFFVQKLLEQHQKQLCSHDYSVARSQEAESVFLAVLEGIKKRYGNVTTQEQFTAYIIESITTPKKE